MKFHPHYTLWTTTDCYCTGHYLFLWPYIFVELCVNAHTWSSHLHHGKLADLFEYPRGTILETDSIDALVNSDGMYSGHYLIDDRIALLLPSLLWESLCQAQLDR